LPLSLTQHLDKAAACLAYAGHSDHHQPLADVCARLAELPDAASALHALQNL
jgi:hypothetical protein